MASQDTVSDGQVGVQSVLKQKDCTDERPIISQQPNHAPSPATARPPLAAKPRRKPPAPSPKPGKPPAPPVPSHKLAQSPTPSSIHLQSNSLPSTNSVQSKDVEKRVNAGTVVKNDGKLGAVQTKDPPPNVQCQSISQHEGSNNNNLPCSNPFEEEGDAETTPSPGNPFEEETELSHYSNPFEEEEDNELLTSSANPFEVETDTRLLSTNPFDEDSEPEQRPSDLATTTPSPRRSSQPPPLPTSPPSQARLSRSLSGFKVCSSSSQNKNDLLSLDVTTTSPCSSQTSSPPPPPPPPPSVACKTQPPSSHSSPQTTVTSSSSSSFPQVVSSSSSSSSSLTSTSTPAAVSSTASSSSSSSPLSSSSLNVSSKSAQQSPPGKSPAPPTRPKPPSAKPSPTPSPQPSSSAAANCTDRINQSSPLHPPPRTARKIRKETAEVSSVSPVPLSQSSNEPSENSSSTLWLSSDAPPKETNSSVKASATPPPPVPKKSAKRVPKPSSSALSNTKHSSPPPPSRPLSPPTKSLSQPADTTTATTTKEILSANVSISQESKPVDNTDDLKKTVVIPDSSAPPSLSPQPPLDDLSQAHVPANPDLPQSAGSPCKPPSGKQEEESFEVSDTAVSATENKQPGKDSDKKKVPPPLPKNPPRGRPLRRSVSGCAHPPDTPPPPPPPPRIPALSSSSRSLSLQDKSLVSKEEHKSKVLTTSVSVDQPQAENCTLTSNSSRLPVAPTRKNREPTAEKANEVVVKQEIESDESSTLSSESAVNQLISSPSVNSICDDVNESRPTISVENNDTQCESSKVDSISISGQPRPVPRKRLSRNSVELANDSRETNTLLVVSEPDCRPNTDKFKIVREHEYSEVYRGDSPEKTLSASAGDSSTRDPQLNQYDINNEGSGDSLCALSHSKQDLGDGADLKDTTLSGSLTKETNDTGSKISEDEPEATCDMLKEIEELLKNKLGVSDESALISLSNDDIDQRISEKEIIEDLEPDNQTEETGDKEEPVRPPRPKRDASLTRDNSGSLNDLHTPKSERRLSTASDFGLGDEVKSAPPKPKRSTLPRVKRSVSDVTAGSRIDFDDKKDSRHKQTTDDTKPQLPPRNESLRKGVLYQSRQQALASAADGVTPPPLPPRNKPRSSSMNVGGSKNDETATPPPKPFLSAKAALKDSSADTTQNKTASPGRGDLSAFTKGALPMSATSQGGVNRSPAPRPMRKAPPPPPHAAAKRNATFGPGDNRSPTSTLAARKPDDDSKSAPQPSRETSPLKSSTPNTTPRTTASASSTPKVKKSKSLFHKFTSKKSEDAEPPKTQPEPPKARPEPPKTQPEPPKTQPEQDAEYHEISDHTKKNDQSLSPHTDERSRVKRSPPPRLPPRPAIILQQAAKHKDNEDAKGDNVESSGASSEGDQSAREKRAQFALIQKVSQDIAASSQQSNSNEDNKRISPTESKQDDNNETERATTTNDGDDDKQKNAIENNQEVVVSRRLEPEKSEDGESNFEYSSSSSVQNEAAADTDTVDTVTHRVGNANNRNNLVIEVINRDRRVSSVSTYSTASDQDDEEGGAAIEDASSHSDTDPEDAEAIYAERKAKKVFNIAQEISSSERTFVGVLKLLNVDFRLHISKETEKHSQPIIPAETLNKILDFLPQLQNFNEDLLKDLEHRVEHWEDNPCMSDIFVKKGPFLKLYSSYIRNFENSTAILDDACKKNQLFTAAVKDFEMSPKCGKLALKHFMLKPIQRIPQYKLLLQEYLKNLHPHSQDYKNTTIALNIVTEVADHANESMRHGDNVQKLLEIQRSLIGQFEVIQPGREFIKQGELQKVSRKVMQPRMFFLFSDVLLYTTPVTSGYKLNNILPLSGMKINNPKLEVYKYEFNIIGVQRSFTLCASSSQEKQEWLEALHSTLDENMKRFNTFESHKGPQTSLIDKDFVLGTKAPLWVPDARVTMCMLCLSEFTITWRRHHCRSCGRIICHQCSNNKAPLRYLQYKPARVCHQCYDKLHSDMLKESQEQQNSDSRLWRKSSFRGNNNEDRTSNPTSPTSPTAHNNNSSSSNNKHDEVDNDSSLSFSRLLSRFHRIRKSGDKRNFRPSVLKEVHANDEGSDMSGYLRIFKNRKWKKLWFVVKGNVLYTYKASEDMAAIESMPLLGYEVTRMNVWYEGAEPDLLFELTHQNTQPLVSKTSGDPMTSPRVMPDLEKTKQRLVFRTDSAAAVTKWLDVLRAASCT